MFKSQAPEQTKLLLLRQQRIKRSKVNQPLFLPPISAVFLFDMVVFIIVFFLTLLSNFTERSVVFNIVISSCFLLKALIGAYFRSIKSFRILRKIMNLRLVLDIVLFIPCVFLFLQRSKAYKYNFVIILLSLLASELLIVLNNCKHLYNKTTIECMEML